ncbi:23S rRNA pseudouridine(2605) synthase RluB [Thioalkalivibrio nitratireducens]
MSERLQKYLAARGLGSRREIEVWIANGEVMVNGRVATLGDQVQAGDEIRVRGRVLRGDERPQRWIAYHKPEGEICSRSDPEGRSSVFSALPRLRDQRWVSVGRLDLNTSGLLLFTTDGDLAHALMHPSQALVREYAVRVLGEVPAETLQGLLAGIELEDGPARFETLVEAGGEGANRWFHVTVSEGRNRLVRRLWEAAGCTVSRLIRIRYGPVALGRGLRVGRFRDLVPEEVAALYEAAGLPRARPAHAHGRPGARGRGAARGKRVRGRPKRNR